jgi:phage protein D
MVSVSTIIDPFASDMGYNAPNFYLKVQGAAIPLGIRQLVDGLEYESVDGYADMLKFTVKNPRYIAPRYEPKIGSLTVGGIAGGGVGSGSGGVLSLEDSKILQVGNEICVGMGYGTRVYHVGRAVIRRVEPSFPPGGMPFLTVTGYSKDCLMMDNAPAESKKKKGKGGRIFKNVRYSDAVIDRARDYGFDLDVDETLSAPSDFIQKAGLSDYDFVRGLANITGYVFWVDGDDTGRWTLHFKNPERLKPVDVWPKEDTNPRKYTFKYDEGNLGTLLSFDPENVIQESTTKLKVRAKNFWTAEIYEVDIEERDIANAPQVLAETDPLRGLFETDQESAGLSPIVMANNAMEGPLQTASLVKVYIGDFSLDLVADRQFASQAELLFWARQWFRRNRENFILGNGTLIGVETLRARQIHALDGIGSAYGGDYDFTRVRHQMNSQRGYTIDFTAHKRVPALVD